MISTGGCGGSGGGSSSQSAFSSAEGSECFVPSMGDTDINDDDSATSASARHRANTSAGIEMDLVGESVFSAATAACKVRYDSISLASDSHLW